MCVKITMNFGKVDTVIICLDDIKKKLKISNFFINHNIPIFVDKPAAYTKTQLKI